MLDLDSVFLFSLSNLAFGTFVFQKVSESIWWNIHAISCLLQRNTMEQNFPDLSHPFKHYSHKSYAHNYNYKLGIVDFVRLIRIQYVGTLLKLRREQIVAAHTFPYLGIVFVIFQCHCSDRHFNGHAGPALVAFGMTFSWEWPSHCLSVVSSFRRFWVMMSNLHPTFLEKFRTWICKKDEAIIHVKDNYEVVGNELTGAGEGAVSRLRGWTKQGWMNVASNRANASVLSSAFWSIFARFWRAQT